MMSAWKWLLLFGTLIFIEVVLEKGWHGIFTVQALLGAILIGFGFLLKKD